VGRRKEKKLRNKREGVRQKDEEKEAK